MKGPKILIVDDATFMRGVLKNILEEEGYTNIIEADSGDTAITKYMTERPNLTLLDIVMPETDGMKVLEDIGKQAKVIIITKIKDERIKEKTQELGAGGYINKPFEKEEVIREVKRVLDKE